MNLLSSPSTNLNIGQKQFTLPLFCKHIAKYVLSSKKKKKPCIYLFSHHHFVPYTLLNLSHLPCLFNIEIIFALIMTLHQKILGINLIIHVLLCKLLNDWIKSYLLRKMLREPLIVNCIRNLIIAVNPRKYYPHFINEVK